MNNLKRIITLKNIKKYKIDTNNNELGIIDIEKFKEKLRSADNDIVKSLEVLGPPKFIKTKFNLKTINKYNIFNGNYFGKARKGEVKLIN